MRFLPLPIIAMLVSGCSHNDPASLCERFFTPYPDLVSGRTRTASNATLLDAMAQYSAKDYTKAIEGLQRVLDRDAGNMTARIYMASAQLAAGDPYKAEMHLDFLENDRGSDYKDQVEWYNALCWLCEGDTAKAAQQARWIASRPQTYRDQAKELAEDLSTR
jgi:thioredoxin-like negative regulator of GroEL